MQKQRIRSRAARRIRVQLGPAVDPADGGALAHAGADLVPQQPQAARPRQGLRPALQHGPRERQGDVDRDAASGQWQEGQAHEQRPLHLENVRPPAAAPLSPSLFTPPFSHTPLLFAFSSSHVCEHCVSQIPGGVCHGFVDGGLVIKPI